MFGFHLFGEYGLRWNGLGFLLAAIGYGVPMGLVLAILTRKAVIQDIVEEKGILRMWLVSFLVGAFIAWEGTMFLYDGVAQRYIPSIDSIYYPLASLILGFAAGIFVYKGISKN